ncbi:hypothetical protein cce_1396 [Crocosphaera subtropica ATCC 51142]|uniref:Uncharacterized protein n=1 Tax=Crocosphaera subtropica (strain ATCC 51142 / BH68) TaxID=43989 RepID=B1WWM2_CROS5|nr:hypothetical protein cce_1396 [Crocosphaera subtropica ATCC 51142]
MTKVNGFYNLIAGDRPLVASCYLNHHWSIYALTKFRQNL